MSLLRFLAKYEHSITGKFNSRIKRKCLPTVLLYKYPEHINLVFLEQICPGLNLVADCVKFLVREKRLLSDAMDFKIIQKKREQDWCFVYTYRQRYRFCERHLFDLF